MPIITRLLLAAAVTAGVSSLRAAEAPKDSPFNQAGSAPVKVSKMQDVEFAGVSTIGKKTVINLFDKQDKRNFWIEVGATSGGITVLKYDGAKDEVTLRQNGTEKVLPLRAESAVVHGTATAVAAPVATAPAVTGTATATTTTTTQMTQARQEEEARMLVSDLLEIGMAQRRAYEEAQRKAAAGQSGSQAQQTAGAAPASAAPAAVAPANATGATAQATTGTTPPSQ